jgi:predicted dehydrogenase
MQSEKLLKVGLVGCGGISHVHAAGIANLPNLTLEACADIEAERAASWAERYRVERWFTDWREMVERVRPEIVLFATWPSQHREQVVAAAEMGVPAILCEKALALTSEEGRAMAEACKRSGTLLMEGFMYRHAPRTKAFLRRIHEGDLGEVRYVRAAFGALFYNPEGTNWRNRKETGGGIPFDFTCYCVNIARAIMGRRPARVCAAAQVCPRQGIIVTLNALLDYGEGVTASLESSQKECFRMEAEAVGTKASLCLPLFLMNLGRQAAPAMRRVEGSVFQGEWKEEQIRTAFEDPYALQIQNLAEALLQGAPLGMELEETLDNLATMDALIESSQTGAFEQVG